MVVANRLTEVSEFVDDDLRVFETLANHANVALENGRLVAHLQHEAQGAGVPGAARPGDGAAEPHDAAGAARDQAIQRAKSTELGVALSSSTSSPSRRSTTRSARPPAIACSSRSATASRPLLPDRAQLAQFTGDQFAVLVTGVVDDRGPRDGPRRGDPHRVRLAVHRRRRVARPRRQPRRRPATRITHRPRRPAPAASRCRHLPARLEGSGIEVYAADTDPYAPRRLALAADLREALERDEVDVYVQPKVSLADGVVVGAEALVRWTHPRLGPLCPDQFIPAAEHTGVIRASSPPTWSATPWPSAERGGTPASTSTSP